MKYIALLQAEHSAQSLDCTHVLRNHAAILVACKNDRINRSLELVCETKP